MSRLPSGQQTSQSATRLTHDTTRSEQNPVLFEAAPHHLMLMYTSQNAGDQDTASVKRLSSHDNSNSWSEPEVLFNDPGVFIRQPMIVLDNGTWVIPVFKCITEPGTRWLGNDDVSCVRASQDHGKTWKEFEVPQSLGCVHMAIHRLKSGPGRYLGMFRSRWADHVYLSRSQDGLNWSAPEATSLLNPNAGVCFDVLESGRVVLVYNHSSKENTVGRREGLYDEIADEGDSRKNQVSKHGKEAFWGAPRAPLCLAWSDDEGRSWEHRVLVEGDGYCMTNNSEEKLNRELDYPSMLVDEEGTIHVAFTY